MITGHLRHLKLYQPRLFHCSYPQPVVSSYFQPTTIDMRIPLQKSIQVLQRSDDMAMTDVIKGESVRLFPEHEKALFFLFSSKTPVTFAAPIDSS